MKQRFSILILAAVAASVLTLLSALAAPRPEPFAATIVRFADADTFTARRSDGSEVKVRLAIVDSPEIASNARERDQPGGREALGYVTRYWLGDIVSIEPTGSESYGRIVALVRSNSLSWWTMQRALVRSGYAWCDPRFKPTASLLAEQKLAKARQRGLWSESNPMPPWEWRKTERERIIRERGQ